MNMGRLGGRHWVALAAGFSLMLLVSCGRDSDDSGKDGKKFSPTRAASEYQMLQAQLKLAATNKPYLVFDFAHKQIAIKLKEMVVWNYPLEVSAEDVAEIGDFVERFHAGNQLVRPITETHLFSGTSKTPDSILNIVSGVTKVKPELMQRELPEHFQLHWTENVIVDIRTDVKGEPTDKFKNTIFEIRHALQKPFVGKSQITIKMPSSSALTLFRIGQPGFPTLVIPPAS
jgi:hypothetical protein